jgi:oligosaccharyltransferase complex subunit alpha (ribophorin I)
MILKEAQRTISVSHWGNIQVDEHFRVENSGPKVKGRYSRIDIDMNHGGQGCLRKLQSEYPYYIKDLYIGDYIGNISSSNAHRSASSVELELRPRYPICGGWQNDWNQGYSMPTRFHL